MNNEQKLNLDKIVNQYKPEETTALIRKLKHSENIRVDVKRFIILQQKYKRMKSSKNYRKIFEKQCSFIHKNYLNIFNRLLGENLDLKVLIQFLDVLRLIESGKINQHEGSVQIGYLLKEMFIDSVLREKSKNKKINKKPNMTISWSEWAKNNQISI